MGLTKVGLDGSTISSSKKPIVGSGWTNNTDHLILTSSKYFQSASVARADSYKIPTLRQASNVVRNYMKTPCKFILTFFISTFTIATFGQNYITEKQFTDKLYSKKICNDKNYQKFLTDIESKQLTDGLDFLKYCDKATIIYLKSYPEKPEEYLQKIHEDVASIIPDLKFTDFKFQIVLDSSISDSDSKFYEFIVSLKSNGKTYKQKSSYHLHSISKNEYFGEKIDQQEFYKIFNKILADIQSPYRLHEVKTSKDNVMIWDRFGIIALTKEQADMLHGGGVFFMPSYESFKNSLTTVRIEKAISEYQKIGLLSHLSAEQIKFATDKAAQQENRNLNDVLQCFPNTIYYFDTELGNLENPYAEILKELSLISKGMFNPTNIIDHFAKPTNKKSLVKFSFYKKEYSKQLLVEDDWIDPHFFDLVKQAVNDNKLNGQFYELYTGGQEASIIFLTIEQEKYLRANNLLTFGDQWQTEEE
ncbi:MAG: hypothetical protein IPN94_17135 [Sphingobacteriales bacterium]|nr:hypothetical protein [Sphingobacteriales bacterium]